MSTQLLSAGAFRLYRQARELAHRHSLKSDREPGPEHMLLAFILRYEHGKPTHQVGTGILSEFGRDLTEAARRGELKPVLFRDNEIAETLETLCRQTENNPILVAEAGVGKTVVAFGVAQA